MAQEKKAAPDWERIEADYRAGILSLREIAAANPGANHVAIARKAKASGWTRDLSAKIKAKADELVTKRTVTADVTAKSPVSEREIIDSGAEAIARIRLAHRTDISRSRALAMALLEELEIETANLDLFRELGEILRSDDDKGQDRRNDLYNKVISSAGRIDGMKKLSDTLKTLIGLEREAYSIGSEAAGGDSNPKQFAASDPIEAAKQYARLMNP
jgi:head-tail adaptor